MLNINDNRLYAKNNILQKKEMLPAQLFYRLLKSANQINNRLQKAANQINNRFLKSANQMNNRLLKATNQPNWTFKLFAKG